MQQLYNAEDEVQLPMMTPQPFPCHHRQAGPRTTIRETRIAAHFGSKSTRYIPDPLPSA